MITIIIVSFLIGLIFAPLGCLVLWKRYVYFGDGLAHTSMLAGILNIIIGVPIIYAGLLVGGLFSFIIFRLRGNSGNSAAIGLTTSVMISLSLVLSDLYPGKIDINQYLMGDIIAANEQDISLLLFVLFLVIAFFLFLYRYLILIILSRDIALSRGVNVMAIEMTFLVLFSFAILLTIKVVGALLVTSVIIIPAMIARMVATSPLSMIIFAIFFSVVMNILGILLSFYGDVSFSPSIILSGGVIYLTIYLAIYLIVFLYKNLFLIRR